MVAVGVGACQSAGVVKDVHMGAQIAYGPEVFASYTGFESLKAQPFYSTKSGYGFTTLRASPFKSAISEAWSYGKQYEYTKGATAKSMCLIQPCMRASYQSGIVAMEEADFLNAAKAGFEFELVGNSTKVVGKVPAAAFQKVLEQKSRLGPVAPVAASAAAAMEKLPQTAVKTEETGTDEDS